MISEEWVLFESFVFFFLGTFSFILAKTKLKTLRGEVLLATTSFLSLSLSRLYLFFRTADIAYYILNLLGFFLLGLFLIKLTTRTLGKLEKLAFFDPLTGVYNRRFIEEYLKEEFRKGKRIKNEFSLLLIDLNDFKQINDRFGHSEGDMVLKKVADELKCNLREYDLIGRWGGDEFLIVLPYISSNNVLEVVSKLSDLRIKHRDITVSLSVGYACYPVDGRTLEELISVADERMYKAKFIIKEVKKHAVENKG